MAKCPICGKTKPHKQDIIDHVESAHCDQIPNNISTAQFIYSLIHGRDYGLCRVCGSKTDWNEITGKPKQLCNNPACKAKRRAIAQRNMIKVYGTDNLLNDPLHQEKMLANRKISGTYTWSDNKHKFTYTGSYEKFAIEWLDKIMNFDPELIEMPGPIVYYDYNGEKKPWITDMYLSGLNLVIEFKDGSFDKNTHEGFSENRKREKAKDDYMKTQNVYNYTKITNKNMMSLVKVINMIRLNNIFGVNNKDRDSQVVVIHESSEINDNNIPIDYSLTSNGYVKINESSNFCIYEKIDHNGVKTDIYLYPDRLKISKDDNAPITIPYSNGYIHNLKKSPIYYMSNTEIEQLCESIATESAIMSVANLSPIQVNGKFEELKESQSPLNQDTHDLKNSTMIFGDGEHSSVTDRDCQGFKTESVSETDFLNRLNNIKNLKSEDDADQMFSDRHTFRTWDPFDSSNNFKEMNEESKSPSPNTEFDLSIPEVRSDIETDPTSYGTNDLSAMAMDNYMSNFQEK